MSPRRGCRGHLEAAVLDRTEHRCREVKIDGADAGAVAEALATLSERGLLFEEDGYVMSLVLPREAPPMTCRWNVMEPKRKLRRAAAGPAAPTIERAARRRWRVKAT